jgi:hypothetical protein
MKDEGHVLHNVESRGYVARTDDGDKQYLLCASCEQRLGIDERYLADFCKGGLDRLERIGVHVDTSGMAHGVSRTRITKSLAGILFKAQFTRLLPWTEMRLPEDWVTALRSYLLRDSGPCLENKIEITASRFYSAIESDINPKSILIARLDIHRNCWRFEIMIGGWTWRCFFLHSPTDSKPGGVWNIDAWGLKSQFRPHVLRDGMAWQVSHGDVLSSYHVNPEFWEDVSDDRDGSVGELDKCSCGLSDLVFAECCKPVWYQR